ncbi:endonuclease VII [Gordonia phage Yvonnetastic]|uniref:Endonuclease VII n=1 Tax=Gordonia phage Yvonnetastic TaxID=1821566 RepID=A0A142K9C3_9CAUD|nr:endonuclease VII [Gordonia phage Yvonnetastic]AMS02706.1 endonuclease VII [Gordonia phage Yvonnetastic]WKW86175.1 hypothetical protein SEA_JONJAMES_167 [Gordonia Phage JonJames]
MVIGTECSVEACDRQAKTRGMCRAHYLRVLRAEKGMRSQGDLSRPVGQRQPCQIDGCTRPHSGHGYCQYHCRRMVHGFEPKIRPEPKTPTEECSVPGCGTVGTQGGGLCSKHYMWLYRYGLHPLEHAWILEQQDGRCAICRSEFSEENRMVIDHDHSCCSGGKSCGGCVRGILCFRCNWGLGSFMDNPQSLRMAADYLDGG